MENIIEDFFKIYISAIESYNSKIFQTINQKYTLIDKAMFTSYLYIKILDEAKIKDDSADELLKNYLLKQIIYGETGNLSLEITDKSKIELYQKVIDNLIIEKFAHLNRMLDCLKYNFKSISNKYNDLLKFCEEIADYCIIEKLFITGNTELKEKLEILKSNFTIKLKHIENNKDILTKEKVKILNSIIKNEFKTNSYKQYLDIAFNLKDVYRYSTLISIVPENVLFHHYLTAVVCIILTEYINSTLNENFNINKLIYKALFHDFSEYNGNEIVTQVKNYNQETIKMFAEMEEADEKVLENKLGPTLYEITVNHKKGPEGYILNIVDKIFGIMKIWIEQKYMNNKTFIKGLCSVYQKRFKWFKNNANVIEAPKTKEFLMDLLRNGYIYIKEHIIENDREIVLNYFLESEVTEFKKEIKTIKENKSAFLAD